MEPCQIRGTTQPLVSRTGAGRQGNIFSFRSREKNVLDFSSPRTWLTTPVESTKRSRQVFGTSDLAECAVNCSYRSTALIDRDVTTSIATVHLIWRWNARQPRRVSELLDAHEREGSYFGAVRVIVAGEAAAFEFGLDESGYLSLKRVLQSRRYRVCGWPVFFQPKHLCPPSQPTCDQLVQRGK